MGQMKIRTHRNLDQNNPNHPVPVVLIEDDFMKALRKFQLHKQPTEKENILHLRGELDLSAAIYLTAELEPFVKEADRTLTLDLRDVTYIDSTGIGIFVSILKVRTAMNAPFRLVHTPASIQRLFTVTGVDRFFADNQEKKEE